MMKRFFIFVVFCLILPSWVSAADYYVRLGGTRTSGVSTPGNWSFNNCYAALDAACSQTGDSDSVVLYKGGSEEIHRITAETDIPAFLVNMDKDSDYSYCIVEFDPSTRLSIRHSIAETTIRGITFRNHPEGDGYQCIGLENNATYRHMVKIESCYFHNNKGKKVVIGGGSCISLSGSNIGGIDLYIHDSIFDSNEASENGGAIHTYGNINSIITNSVFKDNKAGVQNGENGMGGALFLDANGVASLSISGSTFEGNRAGAKGGGIYLANQVTVNISDTKIANNQSGLDESATSNSGGGLWFWRDGGVSTFTMSNCIVSGNICNIDSVYDYADGGGMNLRGAGPSGSVIASLNDTVFSDNYAKQGAGLYVGRYCVATIDRSTFINNTALMNGGASYKGGQYPDCLGETATYNSCIFIGNKAGFYQDGSPVEYSNIGQGGALKTRYYPRIHANNCSFLENKANNSGDSFYHESEGKDFDDDQQRCALINSSFWGTGTNAEVRSQKPFGFTEIANCAFADGELIDRGVIPTGSIILTDNPYITVTISNNRKLIISPPSGRYVTAQRFDLILILEPEKQELSVTGGEATLDGADITAALADCLIPGTLVSDGQTFRCPGLTGDFLGIGNHVLTVTLDLSDGSSVSDSVSWEVLENTEP